MCEHFLDLPVSDSCHIARVTARGYRYKGVQRYAGEDWFAYEFPDRPAKLYIFKHTGDWAKKVYDKARLVDKGSIDYWQGGINQWHSDVIFLGSLPDTTPARVDFRSNGYKHRGEGEIFDYSQVEIKKAGELCEEDFDHEQHFRYSHTVDLAFCMSFDNIVDTVAALSLDYPYFTWDESELYRREDAFIQVGNIRECHCRIFAELLLKLVVAEGADSGVPPDLDHRVRSRLVASPAIVATPKAIDRKQGRRLEGCGACFLLQCGGRFLAQLRRAKSPI